jgi:hypothetical protein
MLTQTEYRIDLDLIEQAVTQLPNFEHRIDLNVSTGDFFYNKWTILPQFKDTVWEQILNTLPIDVGQARLMKLAPEECYRSHADADDRYHLNLIGDKSFLIDLDNSKMFPTEKDGVWYIMDAGKRHSAVNFGGKPRIQLVVRKLMTRGDLLSPNNVSVCLTEPIPNFRYVFDDVFSPWINAKNKLGHIDNFHLPDSTTVSFTTEGVLIQELKTMCPPGFTIKHDNTLLR